MATNYNYPDPADIEAQAKYRPGAASNIFNVLTGGLAGQITGTTQRAQEAARARQALLQEEFNKRDEERAIKKQMMENTLRLKIAAAEGGLGLLPGSNPEEVLAQAMEARKRREIGTEAAQMAALGRTPQGMALLANRQDPAFQSGYGATKRDILGKELEASVQEKIQTPAFRSQLLGMDPNVEIPEGATAAQMKGMIEARRYQLPFQMRQKADVEGLVDMYANNPNLKAFEGYTPETIGKVSPVLAKSLMKLGDKEQMTTADAINKERSAKATEEFAAILQLPAEQRLLPENVARLNYLSSDVPNYWLQSDKFLSAVKAGKPLEQNQLKEIKEYDQSLYGINRFMKALSKVSKNPGSIKKFQNANFGTIANELGNLKSKFFENSDERELAESLYQEYEGFVSGKRLTLFGQSLTLGEGQKGDINFGTPKDKNFFNRALQFIDRTVGYDPVTFYLDSGKSVPDGTVTGISRKKKEFKEYVSNPEVSRLLGVFGNNSQQQQQPQQKQSVLSPEEEARKQELIKKLGKTK
jgi:hypothetical protein